MHINAIEEIERELCDIDNRLNSLKNSPNRAFVLIEYETLSSFHFFNLFLKQFWDEFDHSVNQLLLFKKFMKIHSQLSDRYVALLREQIEYLDDVVDVKDKCLTYLPPVIFVEDNTTDVLGYYLEYFKNDKDDNGEPLYQIEKEDGDNYEVINGKEVPFTPYMFRSNIINDVYYDGLYNMYRCLNNIYGMMGGILSYPESLLSGYSPSEHEIVEVLDRELRQHAKEDGQSIYRELRKIFLELKRSNSHSQPSDVWAQVLEVEDDAFRLAIAGKLIENKERLFDHYDEDKRKLWTDNFKLLQKIKDTCIDDELFDVGLSVRTYNLLSALNADNLDLFFEIVLRRNIIHREMFPETLKAQYEEWLNRTDEQSVEDGETGLSDARQSKLDEIIGILKKGNWKQPATADKIDQLMNTIFGRDISMLEEEDIPKCEKMWAYAEEGGGDRMLIVPANLAGFFREENLLQGTPTEISNDLFGNNNQVNNINKGKPNNCSRSFSDVISFLRKYINMIIRQV